jgi:hypothetical protein
MSAARRKAASRPARYDRSAIMKRARREYQQRKAFGRPVSWSEAMKIAWRVAKHVDQLKLAA